MLPKPPKAPGLVRPAPVAPKLVAKPSRPKGERAAFIELAKARHKQAQAADSEQLARETAALRFYAGDQWPEDVKNARSGSSATQGTGVAPTPARPCLTVDKIREPIRQVLNQERMADMGASLVPADDFGALPSPISHEEIELREGLLRRIQRESHAADARTWAFDRAVKAGRGYYAITTEYAPGKTFDQEIKYRRIYNQAGVLLDPAHEQPDGSDAAWGFISTWVPWDEYRTLFPKRNGKPNRWAGLSDPAEAWQTIGAEAPEWVQGQDNQPETRALLVVEYFYREFAPRTLCQLSDGSSQWKDELPVNLPEGVIVDERDVQEPQIKWAKIDGCDDDVLEETDWPGRYLPVVKVCGEELQPYDTKRRLQGMVEPAMSSNQGFNYMISAMVETIALAPKAPVVGVAGQFEGFEALWDAANVRNIGRLEYNARVDGVPETLPPPQRQVSEPPIQAIAVALREFDAAIRATTGGAVGLSDPSVGGVDPALRSGKAIRALLDSRQMGTSNFLDNLKRSVDYEGRIVNDLLFPIYGRPGRLLRMLNGQNEPESVLVGVPFVTEGEQGVPKPVEEGTEGARKVTLTEGATFNIAVKVGRDYDTRRQEEGTAAGELIASNPEFMAWFGDIFLKNQDWPGSTEMAERAKVMLAPPIQQMLSQQTPLPPAAQQQIAQLTQQLEQVTGFAQQLHQEKETKQVEQQAKLQEATLKEQAENEREAMRLQAEMALNDAKIQLELRKLEVTAEIEAAKLGSAESLKRLELEQQALHAHSQEQLALEELGASQAQADMDRQAGREDAEAERQLRRVEGVESREMQREESAEGRAFEAEQAERARMTDSGETV